MTDLTPIESNVVTFIRTTIQRRGYGPTAREIGDAGVAPRSDVPQLLRSLGAKCAIATSPVRDRPVWLDDGMPDDDDDGSRN